MSSQSNLIKTFRKPTVPLKNNIQLSSIEKDKTINAETENTCVSDSHFGNLVHSLDIKWK